MPRFSRLLLLLAGLWGVIGCQPQGSSSGAPSLSTPSGVGSAAVQSVAEKVANPADVGETGSGTGVSDGASSNATALPADAGSTADASDTTKPAGTPPDSPPPTVPTRTESPAASASAEEAGYVQTAAPGTPSELPQNRTFRPEGAEQALRITYDDLDLLKWLQMDPVTPDCVEKMPEWLRGLNGKKVRLRGFMKPHEISTGFRRFIFVKDTGLCCFGPAGKIYDLIQVTLLKGTTTDYIELTPFDVIGTLRIEVAALDDTQEVYELFHIDDAKIVRK